MLLLNRNGFVVVPATAGPVIVQEPDVPPSKVIAPVWEVTTPNCRFACAVIKPLAVIDVKVIGLGAARLIVCR